MKLDVRSLGKTFQAADRSLATTVVDDVSFIVPDGQVISLLGPSGCGKTTVLRMVAGLEEPSSGAIYLGENPLFLMGSKNVPPQKRSMGMVFQQYALWPHMTVEGNVGFPLEMKRFGKKQIQEKVREVLSLVGLEDLAHRYPHELSGGQQQRVALARAVGMEPNVLLLDEPLSNLDTKLREQMRRELKSLQKRLGLTMLYVTHDRLEALELSDLMAVMDHGKIIQLGSPSEIRQNPANDFVKHFIGGE